MFRPSSPCGELDELRNELERYQREVLPRLEPFRAVYDLDGDKRSLKHLVDMDKADEFFAAVLQGSRAEGLAAALLGEDVAPQGLAFFDKGPRIGKPTPAHQDGYYFCLKPNHALTFWIALDDCDEQNGCMYLCAGFASPGRRSTIMLRAWSGSRRAFRRTNGAARNCGRPRAMPATALPITRS